MKAARTIVLEYAGPPLWPSYQDIYPALKKVWQCLDLQVEKIWYPFPNLDEKSRDRILRAETLILPLGTIHSDGLSTLQMLRSQGFKGRALIMCAGDGVSGQMYLRSRASALRSNDVLITNCPNEKKSILGELMGGGKKPAPLRIESIPLPVDTSIFKPLTASARQKQRDQLGLQKN